MSIFPVRFHQKLRLPDCRKFRPHAPIFAADEVIEESGIEFEGEEVTEEEIESKVSEFKQFLEQVTPDEFAVDPDDD